VKELDPDEGINRLQHPDCRACKERERVNVGLLAENAQLKKKLGEGGGDADRDRRGNQAEERQHVAEGGSVLCDGVALALVISDIEALLDHRLDPAALNAYSHCLGLLSGLTQQSSPRQKSSCAPMDLGHGVKEHSPRCPLSKESSGRQ
jgi:hypothetical protein